MSHVNGEVAEDTLEAIVRLRFNAEVEVDCVVDTGFSGALVLPRSVVNQLNLPIIGHETFEMVGGTQSNADIALGQIDWLGERRRVDVIIEDDFLIGTALLEGTQLFIDYTTRIVRIPKGRVVSNPLCN